jgi:hypothetical protein
MLQLFNVDVVKVDWDVAYVAMVVHVCCKLVFPMFHLFFQTYAASMFIWILHIFHTLCCKCFICMLRMFYNGFQVFFTCVLQVF